MWRGYEMIPVNCSDRGEEHQWRALTEEEAQEIEAKVQSATGLTGLSVTALHGFDSTRDIRQAVRKCSVCEDIG